MAIPRAWRRKIRPLWLLAGLLGATAALAEEEESAPTVAPAEMQARVKTAKAIAGELPVSLRALGTVGLRPRAPGRIVTRLPGIVTAVLVNDGDEVTTGAFLAEIDPAPYRAALAKAESGVALAAGELRKAREGGLDAAQAELDLATINSKITARQAAQEAVRQAALLKENLGSEKAATQAKEAAEAADLAAKAAEDKTRRFRTSERAIELKRLESLSAQALADLEVAERDLEATRIRAPGCGRVAALSLQAGQMIDAGGSIADLYSGDVLAVRFELSPAEAALVAIGGTAELDRIGREPLRARILSISGGTDAQTGLVAVLAELQPQDSPPRLGEVLPATVQTTKSAGGVIVPAGAILVNEAQATVFVVGSDQIAHSVSVRLLSRNGDRAVVAGEGLADGATVIVDGNFNLPEGAHVVEEPAK